MEIKELISLRSRFETVEFKDLKDLLIETSRSNGIVDNIINDLFTVGILIIDNEVCFKSFKNLAVVAINSQINKEINKINKINNYAGEHKRRRK